MEPVTTPCQFCRAPIHAHIVQYPDGDYAIEGEPFCSIACEQAFDWQTDLNAWGADQAGLTREERLERGLGTLEDILGDDA